jgi:hypothetical protein
LKVRAGLPLILALVLLLPLAARAQQVPIGSIPYVSIDEMDPSDEGALATSDQVSVKVKYRADDEVQIFVRPYFQGRQVDAMGNASPRYPQGSGEAFGWFQGIASGQVDEVRVTMTELQSGRVFEDSRKVDFYFMGGSRAPHPKAAWAVELGRKQQALIEQQAAEHASKPDPGGDLLSTAFMLIAMGLMLAGMGLPLYGVLKWDGRWRVAAAILFALFGFVVLRIIIGTTIDPTSHNLWPFEVLIGGFFSTLAMIVMLAIRRARAER